MCLIQISYSKLFSSLQIDLYSQHILGLKLIPSLLDYIEKLEILDGYNLALQCSFP